MKSLPTAAVKILLPLLLFLSSGGSNLFACSFFPDLPKEDSQKEESVRPAPTYKWAIRENTAQEFSDPSENHFFGNFLRCEPLSQQVSQDDATEIASGYQRDIRRVLSNLTFPSHFFF